MSTECEKQNKQHTVLAWFMCVSKATKEHHKRYLAAYASTYNYTWPSETNELVHQKEIEITFSHKHTYIQLISTQDLQN